MIIFMLLLLTCCRTSGLGLSSCPARQVAASKSWPQMLGFKKLPLFLHMSSRSFPGSPGPTGAHTGSGRKSSGYQLLKPLHTVTLNMRHMPNPQSSQKENPFCNEPRGPRRTKSIRSKKLYWPLPLIRTVAGNAHMELSDSWDLAHVCTLDGGSTFHVQTWCRTLHAAVLPFPEHAQAPFAAARPPDAIGDSQPPNLDVAAA